MSDPILEVLSIICTFLWAFSFSGLAVLKTLRGMYLHGLGYGSAASINVALLVLYFFFDLPYLKVLVPALVVTLTVLLAMHWEEIKKKIRSNPNKETK